MRSRLVSSKQRFRDYKRDLKSRRKSKSEAGQLQQPVSAARDQSDVRPSRRNRTFFRLFAEFWHHLREFRGRLILALCTVTVSTGLGLLPPYATKLVVDNILGTHPLPEALRGILPLPASKHGQLAAVGLGIILITLVSVVIGMWGRWQATKTVVRIKPAIRRRVIEHALRLPLHRVYQLKTGGTVSLLREDTGAFGELIFSMLYNPWRAVVQLIGSLAILALVDWRLLVGSIIFLPIVYFTHQLWISRIRPLYRDIHSSRQSLDSQATEAFGGIRVVRSFGRQKSESARYVVGDQFRARQEAHVWWWSRGVDIAWSIFIPIASAALLWYGGSRVLNGDLTIGDLFLFLTYLLMLLEPVALLAQSATGFQTSLAGLDRVLDLLDEPVEMPAAPGAIIVNPTHVQGRITLRNVHFSYPGTSTNVLEDITLDVQPGEMIALVGPSGAGKTTLCNLIARFYDPTLGVIELDGRDLRQIEVESYRRLLGIVEQEIFLFDGNVADNIGYGRRDAEMSQIEHYARMAHAHEFISEFERGYETLIGERGVKLSGGQRQRLAIARALLADPRILILDEATSNLDTENERLIQQSLHTLMAGRTSFVIAHRLSTIAHADRIVVLEHGRVVEQGTHAELMARDLQDGGGRYRRMVQIQTEPPRQQVKTNGQVQSGPHSQPAG